jgi:CRISPR-associated protein Cmr4
MKNFNIGYLYSLSPIHCGGEGDLGNILEIVREVHTSFPYIPSSSLRGSLRDEVENIDAQTATNLFGKELDDDGQMGVHQVWFGDARLLWIPMRTMSLNNRDIFTWVSCHSLMRDHAILNQQSFVTFPDHPVGTKAGSYDVADAKLNVSLLKDEQKEAISFVTDFPDSLKDTVQPTWEQNHLILPDSDFQVLLEHSLWTQIRNKIDEKKGSAEVFWTDVCIPRDTFFYFPWGYNLLKDNLRQNNHIIQSPVTQEQHQVLIDVLQGLIQVGGQANVGRGWVQSWISNLTLPSLIKSNSTQTTTVGV